MNGLDSRIRAPLLAALFLTATPPAAVPDSSKGDAHYTEAGYFDIYVCQWPDRPVFLVGLFSTVRSDIKRVEVYFPDGTRLGEIGFSAHELLHDMDGQMQRVYKTQFPPNRPIPNGWYSARVTLNDGRQFTARDYVERHVMPIVVDLVPQGSDIPLRDARTLRWRPLEGDVYYRVTIYDMWHDKELIYTSDLLRQPRLQLPLGLLQPNGSYIWRVHARQATHDLKWGDFNHGSKSAETLLSTGR